MAMELGNRRERLSVAMKVAVLALGLSVLKAAEFLMSQNLLSTMMAGQLPAAVWFNLVLMLVAFSAAVLGAFTLMIKSELERGAAVASAAIFALVIGSETGNLLNPLDDIAHFGLDLVCQAIYAFSVCFLAVRCINVAGQLRKWPPFIAAGTILLTGGIALTIRSWVVLDDAHHWIYLARDIGLLATIGGVLAVASFFKSFQLDRKSIAHSFRLRLPLSTDQGLWRITLASIVLGAAGSLFYQFAIILTDAKPFILPSVAAFSFVGPCFFIVSLIVRHVMTHKQGAITERLAGTHAKRFVNRHLKNEQAWAATVGLKTTNFTIDHDPGGYLHGNLPASLMQIRSEEIQRCVKLVLGGESLHTQGIGHRIFGAIDPENSLRPCIAVLKLFASLYLDASPLVERRIKGLTSLLPIVDPQLARMLNAGEINQMIRRNQWFFHFDFSWIDQHIIHTPQSTRYDVMLATLPSRSRDAMLEYLDKKGGIGNFIWLGLEARNRLLQEAHVLRNIIETCPVPADNGVDEQLMFTIKFEALIPRLQRYFNLDAIRKTLLDFDPSPENERLFNLLGLQIAKSNSPATIREVLRSIESIPWRGFREKDSALQLITKAYANLMEIARAPGSAGLDDPEIKKLHGEILLTVNNIGYPSQMLHLAQINKLALRDIQKLKEAAMSKSHDRFQEAWLLLASHDFSRVPGAQRDSLLELLKSAASKSQLMSKRLVQAKIVDALTNIGRLTESPSHDLVRTTLAAISHGLVEHAAHPDILCLLLDAQHYLSSTLQTTIDFEPTTIGTLDGYFNRLQDDLGISHPDVIAIMSRWQEFRTRNVKHRTETNSVA